MFLASFLDNPNYQSIKKIYEHWYQYMEQNVEFWLSDSEWHTKSHSARVLILALLIGHQKGLSDAEQDALAMAAIFHDSRRLDDGIDKGHGKRAADYYKEYCQEQQLLYNELTYFIIYYHDQDDAIGLSKIEHLSSIAERGTLLYQIFKDADGLDRFRLGPNALDARMLRTEEAKQMVDFARALLQESQLYS